MYALPIVVGKGAIASAANTTYMAKYQFQIRTGDFEYIMQEMEAATSKEAVVAYKELKNAYWTGGGISDREFNAIYDQYRKTRNIVGDPGIISSMSDAQRFALNELKKSFKRN